VIVFIDLLLEAGKAACLRELITVGVLWFN
jgi:hypothetical protein